MEHPRQFKFIHLLLWEILELFMVQEKIMEPIIFLLVWYYYMCATGEHQPKTFR